MARTIFISGSDHIVAIAARHHFRDWRTLWNLPENSHLRGVRRNPCQLYHGVPGQTSQDRVFLPDVDPKEDTQSTETHTPYTVPAIEVWLKLRILKPDLRPVADAAYELHFEGEAAPRAGTTTAAGRIELRMPSLCRSARLRVTLDAARANAAPGPGGPGGASPPPDPKTRGQEVAVWNLRIGALNPIKEDAPDAFCTPGVQQRLNNLGYYAGPINGERGVAATQAALRRFQAAHGLNIDGRVTLATVDKLRQVHDGATDPAPLESRGGGEAAGTDQTVPPSPGGAPAAPTPAEAIGQVAPSVPSHPDWSLNTLIFRPQLRVSLRLGAIEELFNEAPNSVRGRMARLQVVGLFYHALGHARASISFNGIAAAGGGTGFRGVWDHFRAVVLNGANEAAADADVQRRLREWVVAGGRLPPPVVEGQTPAEANFTKLRFPGAYTFFNHWSNNAINANKDNAAPYRNWGFDANPHEVEARFVQDNPVLGRVPIVATVEKFDPASFQWVGVPDQQVYLQLVDPYPLPAFDPARAVTAQFNRPPLRTTSVGPPVAAAGAGPARLVNREVPPTGPRAPVATDPQRGNARHDRGGKAGQGSIGQGTDVAGPIFNVAGIRGFNSPSDPPQGGATSNPNRRTTFFPQAEKVADSARPHAVKAKSDARGEAGFLFTPSRIGGDCYRFKAFLGPDSLTGPGADGKGPLAITAETGTLVTWRHIPVSRYVQQRMGAPHATLLAEAASAPFNVTGVPGATPPITPAQHYQWLFYGWSSATGFVGVGNASFATQVPPPPAPGGAAVYDPLPVNWARSFCEMVPERDGAVLAPTVLTTAEWNAARQQALADGVVGVNRLSLRLDVAALLFLDATAPADLTPENAIAHLPMRTQAAYNALVPANRRIGTGPNTIAAVDTLFWDFLAPGFLRHLTQNGNTCGVSLVQGGFGSTWQGFDRLGVPVRISGNSGVAIDYRAGYVWCGACAYPPTPGSWACYGLESNFAHELGHTLFRPHAPGFDPGGGAGGGFSVQRHDALGAGATGNRSICVMSYKTCEGHFCGKCVLGFAGWDVGQIP